MLHRDLLQGIRGSPRTRVVCVIDTRYVSTVTVRQRLRAVLTAVLRPISDTAESPVPLSMV